MKHVFYFTFYCLDTTKLLYKKESFVTLSHITYI